MNSSICVIAEYKSNRITDGTFEAISAGRSITKQLNTGVALLVLGNGLSTLSSNLSQSSADNVYLFDNPLLAQYTSDAYIGCLEPFIKQQKPSMLFIPSTCLGRDLAPKLAARLKTAYISDVSGIEISNSGILLSRPVYGGRLLSTVTCTGEKPWIITLRPRAFEKGDADSKNAKIESPAVNLSPKHIRTAIKGIEQTQKGLGLTEADIIISGVGVPKLIRGDMVKQGAVVIDFGYGKVDGKLSGDVDFDEVSQKASLITPVPGGVGPLVCATALSNVLTLLKDHPFIVRLFYTFQVSHSKEGFGVTFLAL